jgi:hypothetical protein
MAFTPGANAILTFGAAPVDFNRYVSRQLEIAALRPDNPIEVCKSKSDVRIMNLPLQMTRGGSRKSERRHRKEKKILVVGR